MKQVIIDTNMLMAIAQFKVDIFSEIDRICEFTHEIAVLDKTISELKKIAQSSGKDGKSAALALKIITAKKITIIKTDSPKPTDDVLVDYSNGGAIVATQDAALKRKLKKPIIVLRDKGHLELI